VIPSSKATRPRLPRDLDKIFVIETGLVDLASLCASYPPRADIRVKESNRAR